jgi:hypothetical protein
LYAGCIAGALPEEEYLSIIRETGFMTVEVKKRRRIELPDELLQKYLSPVEAKNFKEGVTGIFSITVTAFRPEGCGCCCGS